MWVYVSRAVNLLAAAGAKHRQGSWIEAIPFQVMPLAEAILIRRLPAVTEELQRYEVCGITILLHEPIMPRAAATVSPRFKATMNLAFGFV